MALSICNSQTDFYDRELAKHGDSAFPIACYEDDLSKENVMWHWHDEWEFAIVTKGNPEFFTDTLHLNIKEGDGIFFNSKALHAVNNNEAHPSVIHSAVFHPRLIGGNTDSVYWQSLVQPFEANSSTRFILLSADVEWQNEVMQHYERAWQALANDVEWYEDIVRFELSTATRLLVKNTDFSYSKLSEQEQINASRLRIMLEYIEEHYNDDITTATLASAIMASESVCLRCFRQTLATTPIQYVKQLRVRKSADLLLTTSKPVKEIALSCGFNDISYFVKCFKGIYGSTPTAYRASNGVR